MEDLDLADLPFEVLQQIQRKVGVKRFKEYLRAAEGGGAAAAVTTTDADDEPSGGGASRGRADRKPKRKAARTKGAPVESSSRRPVSKRRKVVPAYSGPQRDPRFDTLSGSYNDELWSKSYGFLDEKRAEECAELKKQIKKAKDPEKKEELQRLLQSVRGRMDERARVEAARKVKSVRSRAERDLVAKGKRPFYLKEADAKGLEKIEQFEEIKKKGGSVSKKLAARRKRDASKLRRHLPS